VKDAGPYLEAAFALAVTGAALIFPPLALLVAAVFLAANAYLIDQRTAPEAE